MESTSLLHIETGNSGGGSSNLDEEARRRPSVKLKRLQRASGRNRSYDWRESSRTEGAGQGEVRAQWQVEKTEMRRGNAIRGSTQGGSA